jgi:hypothetical protein
MAVLELGASGLKLGLMCVPYLTVARLTEQFTRASARLKYKPTAARGVSFEEKVILGVF